MDTGNRGQNANSAKGSEPETKRIETWVSDQTTILAEAFEKSITSQRLKIYAKTLAPLGKERLQVAFGRALREKKFFPTVAELIELAGVDPAQDGRPGPEEAWQMCPRTEEQSVVWTAEMAEAFGLVRLDGDLVAARMAFREKYSQLVAEARSRGQPVEWQVSLGWDAPGRVEVLARAVSERKISLRAAEALVGEHAELLRNALPGGRKLLPGEVSKADTGRLNPVQKALHLLAESKSLPGFLDKHKPKSEPDRKAIQQAAVLKGA
jgi:hypothetical protein